MALPASSLSLLPCCLCSCGARSVGGGVGFFFSPLAPSSSAAPWGAFFGGGASKGASSRASIGASNGCSRVDRWVTFARPLKIFRPSSDAVFEHLERASRAGLECVVRGMNGGLIGGVARELFLPRSAFSKWNMRKVSIFRAWKSLVLPRNSAVFGRKWSSSATIHSESDCSHI